MHPQIMQNAYLQFHAKILFLGRTALECLNS